MAIVRVECCRTAASAETRRAALEALGFDVKVVRNASVVKANCGEDEEFVFDDCSFLVLAESD
jgi:hypothetical protein